MAKAKKKSKAKKPERKALTCSNDAFLVTRYKRGLDTVSIYVLPPHNVFQGFGGSSAGQSSGKEGSMVVRREGPGGCEDREYLPTNFLQWRNVFADHSRAGG